MKENIGNFARLSIRTLIAVSFALVYFRFAFTRTPEIFQIVFSVVLVVAAFICFYTHYVVSGAKSVKIRKQMN